MIQFKDLEIEQKSAGFEGDQIPFKRILDKEIIIHSFKIGPSKFEGERLDIQITFKDEKCLIWTSSAYLKATILKIPKDKFPIVTTIIKKPDDSYAFT